MTAEQQRAIETDTVEAYRAGYQCGVNNLEPAEFWSWNPLLGERWAFNAGRWEGAADAAGRR